MEDWIESTLDEIAFVNPRESMPKGSLGKKIAMEDVQPFKKFVPSFSIDKYSGGVKFRNGDTLMARITPSLENGKTSIVNILDDNEVGFGSTEFIVLREKPNISKNNFLY